MKNKIKNQIGISTLVLVFIVASLMTLIISVLILVTFLSATRSAQSLHTQKVFFAAEGALYATIQRLKDDPTWSPPEEYQIGDITIKTDISSSNGGVNILVTATLKGTKRTLAGTYGVGEAGRLPLDIILVIDISGSMEYFCGGEGQDPCPIYYAKEAAKNFVNHIDLTAEDAIGIVSYSKEATKDLPLTLRKDEIAINSIKSTIDNLNAMGNTNIGHAIQLAKEELDNPDKPEIRAPPRDYPEPIKVIIVLSDGIANQESTLLIKICPNSSPCCETAACMNPYPGNPYRPENDAGENSGNPCTNDVIARAIEAKDNDYHVFSIFLENLTHSSCRCNDDDQCPNQYRGPDCLGNQDCIPSTEDLASRTLEAVASQDTYYFPIDEAGELDPIYNQIAETITSPGFFKIWEEVPEPEPD